MCDLIKKIGQKTKQLRTMYRHEDEWKPPGLSLQKFADLIGISKAHLYELECGKVNHPSIIVLQRISDIGMVPLSHFIDDFYDPAYSIIYRELERVFTKMTVEDKLMFLNIGQAIIEGRSYHV